LFTLFFSVLNQINDCFGIKKNNLNLKDDENGNNNNRGWLSRATMLVQNDFHVANFRAKRILIAHYEGMTESMGGQPTIGRMPPKVRK
jgi:hypothetical protein